MDVNLGELDDFGIPTCGRTRARRNLLFLNLGTIFLVLVSNHHIRDVWLQ
jgi:hypothetical protein